MLRHPGRGTDVTGTGPEAASLAAPAVVTLCHEYAALAGAAVASLADFLADAAALAVRLLPSAQSARIRVRVPEVVTAIADAPDASCSRTPLATDLAGRASQSEVLAIPLVGGGDLAGVLELDPGCPERLPGGRARARRGARRPTHAEPGQRRRLTPRVATFAAASRHLRPSRASRVPPSVAVPLAGTVQRHVDRGR